MPIQFNPPPTWPAPPQGFAPPPGWAPDPSWPPPPPGWALWIETSSVFVKPVDDLEELRATVRHMSPGLGPKPEWPGDRTADHARRVRPLPATPISQLPAPDTTREPVKPPTPASTPMPRQISSWQTAEENAAEWMRAWGYQSVALTVAGADAGVDVHAVGAIAQVKFEASQVGRPALQKLVGARGRDTDLVMLFFSGAGYSRPAVDYGNELGIGLFHYNLTGQMSALNERGRVLAERSGTPLQPTAEQERQLHLKQQHLTAIDQWHAAKRERFLWNTYESIAEQGESWRSCAGGMPRPVAETLNVRVQKLYQEAAKAGPVPAWMIFPPSPSWRTMEPPKPEFPTMGT